MLLIADGSHILYRMLYSAPLVSLSSASGLPTGGIFGTLRTVRKMIYELHPHSCVVVFDGRHSERRKGLYPSYKNSKHRQSDDPEYVRIRELYTQQSRLIMAVLRSLAVHVLKIEDMEGDDVIYQITRMSPHYNVVAAEDKDFLQLIDVMTNMYFPVKDEEVTVANFEQVVGIPPEKFLLCKALVGDPSDNIKGVPGVGEKRAAKVLQENSTLEELLLWAESQKAVTFRKIAEYSHVIERNLELMDLSLEPVSQENLLYILEVLSSPVSLEPGKLKKGFDFLGFHSILEDFEKWIAPFRILGQAL